MSSKAHYERCDGCGEEGSAPMEVDGHPVCDSCHWALSRILDNLLATPGALAAARRANTEQVARGWLAAHPEVGLTADEFMGMAGTAADIKALPEDQP